MLVSDSIEDIDHGNKDVEFMLRAFENGIEFTREDMILLSNTFISNLWNGDIVEPSFNKFVDGSGGIHEQPWVCNWIKLARFNSEILNISTKYYINNWDLIKCLVDKYGFNQRLLLGFTKILK